jgi:hypothetical protein
VCVLSSWIVRKVVLMSHRPYVKQSVCVAMACLTAAMTYGPAARHSIQLARYPDPVAVSDTCGCCQHRRGSVHGHAPGPSLPAAADPGGCRRSGDFPVLLPRTTRSGAPSAASLQALLCIGTQWQSLAEASAVTTSFVGCCHFAATMACPAAVGSCMLHCQPDPVQHQLQWCAAKEHKHHSASMPPVLLHSAAHLSAAGHVPGAGGGAGRGGAAWAALPGVSSAGGGRGVRVRHEDGWWGHVRAAERGKGAPVEDFMSSNIRHSSTLDAS